MNTFRNWRHAQKNERDAAPQGRLIVGAYGSKSDAVSPLDIADFLESAGFVVAGRAEGGTPPIMKFAWIDA